MQNSIYFIRNVNPLKLRGQWDHSGTNKSGWIRLAICLIIFDKSIWFNFLGKQTMQNVSSKTVHYVKIYLPLFVSFVYHFYYVLGIASNFFSAIGTSYGTTGSSGKSISGVISVGKGPWLVYFICRHIVRLFFLSNGNIFWRRFLFFKLNFLTVLIPWYPFPSVNWVLNFH